jgi:hypothetical protein
MAQTPAERRAAQQRIGRDLRTGQFKPSPIGRRAREAAAIGSSSPDDIRADLEERTLRHAVALYGDDFKFNRDAVETRIKGGVILTRDKSAEYIPLARIEKGNVVHPDGSITSSGKAKAIEINGMTNDQLRNAISMTKDEWDKMAKRKLGHGRINRWMYH